MSHADWLCAHCNATNSGLAPICRKCSRQKNVSKAAKVVKPDGEEYPPDLFGPKPK